MKLKIVVLLFKRGFSFVIYNIYKMNFGNAGTETGSSTNPLSKFTSGLTSGTSNTMGSNDFMQSNSLVAKVAFLLLVLFGFIVLLRIGIAIL